MKKPTSLTHTTSLPRTSPTAFCGGLNMKACVCTVGRGRYRRVKSFSDNDDECPRTALLGLEESTRHHHDHSKVSKMIKVVSPRLLLPKIVGSPAKMLRRCRDAYVERMLCFAGHVAQLNEGCCVFLLKRIAD